MNRRAIRLLTITAFLLALAPISGAAQERPTLTPDDYGQWESLTFGGTALSPDGQWLAYGIRRVNEETEIRIRSLRRRVAKAGGSD